MKNGSNNLSALEAKYLSQVIDDKSLDLVSDVDSIQAYADAVIALIATSAVNDNSTGDITGAITQDQFDLLGLSLINSDLRHSQVVNYLKTAAVDFSASSPAHIFQIREELISTLTDLQELERVAELDIATNSAPGVTRYSAVNANTPGAVAADNLEFLNSVLNTSEVSGSDVTIAADVVALALLSRKVVTAATSGGSALTLAQDEFESLAWPALARQRPVPRLKLLCLMR